MQYETARWIPRSERAFAFRCEEGETPYEHQESSSEEDYSSNHEWCAAAMPVESYIKKFYGEFDAHISQQRCSVAGDRLQIARLN